MMTRRRLRKEISMSQLIMPCSTPPEALSLCSGVLTRGDVFGRPMRKTPAGTRVPSSFRARPVSVRRISRQKGSARHRQTSVQLPSSQIFALSESLRTRRNMPLALRRWLGWLTMTKRRPRRLCSGGHRPWRRLGDLEHGCGWVLYTRHRYGLDGKECYHGQTRRETGSQRACTFTACHHGTGAKGHADGAEKDPHNQDYSYRDIPSSEAHG
jgi:hypothetical protein